KSLTSLDRWQTTATVADNAASASGSPEQTTIQLDAGATVDRPHLADSPALQSTSDSQAGPADAVSSARWANDWSRVLAHHAPAGDSSQGQPESRLDRPEVPGFEVMECLGEGGMGIVYRARQVALDRLVALKVIRGGALARRQHLARLRIEAEAVA